MVSPRFPRTGSPVSGSRKTSRCGGWSRSSPSRLEPLVVASRLCWRDKHRDGRPAIPGPHRSLGPRKQPVSVTTQAGVGRVHDDARAARRPVDGERVLGGVDPRMSKRILWRRRCVEFERARSADEFADEPRRGAPEVVWRESEHAAQQFRGRERSLSAQSLAAGGTARDGFRAAVRGGIPRSSRTPAARRLSPTTAGWLYASSTGVARGAVARGSPVPLPLLE